MNELNVSILGGSGYAGGEFLRLALAHPHLRVQQVSSREYAGYPLHIVHPNLRGTTDVRFVHPDELEATDVLVAALPHGQFSKLLCRYAGSAKYLVDLSGDFRLQSPTDYRNTYGKEHELPAELGTFVYALPELNRQQLQGARRVAGAGCIATATTLALHPVSSLLDPGKPVVVDAKIGSSAAGSGANRSTHHPVRSGSLRTYAATRHRHEAEVRQALPAAPPVHLTATAVERVRGVLATVHAFVRQGVSETQLLQAFRAAYDDEPFVRLVRARKGVHRVPDPKVLDGTNYCDVGFELDESNGRLVVLSALDNLVKGTAGHALQALNIAAGYPEGAGLSFIGLYP